LNADLIVAFSVDTGAAFMQFCYSRIICVASIIILCKVIS